MWLEFGPQNPNYSLPYSHLHWVHYETVVVLPHCYLTYPAVVAGSSAVAVIGFLEVPESDFVEVNYLHLMSAVEGVVVAAAAAAAAAVVRVDGDLRIYHYCCEVNSA